MIMTDMGMLESKFIFKKVISIILLYFKKFHIDVSYTFDK